MTTAEGSQGPSASRPPVGEPGPAWSGDGALARRLRPELSPAHRRHPTYPAPTARTVGGYEVASVWRRASAFALDLVVLSLLMAPFFALQGVPPESVVGGQVAANDLAQLRLTELIIFIGYFWYWNSRGWSPGKRLLGLRVVTESGQPPAPGRALRRAVVAALSYALFFQGHLWALVDGHRQAWHDKVAGTYVVRHDPGRASSDRTSPGAGDR
jgi:uncharacterized RDD family membrane protein YckC